MSKQRCFQLISITYLAVMLFAGSCFAYSGGSGTEVDPYQIAAVSDWNDLMNTSSDWNKYFIMTADVNLQGVALIPVGYFTGVFDGNGHIIYNACINRPTSNQVGLFGESRGQIHNLGVVDVEITGGSFCTGGLVGYNNTGTITACYAAGAVNGDRYVGGLTGYNQGTITTCYAAGSVNGSDDIGGLAGYNQGTITACYAAGSVNGNKEVGGLVGRNGREGPIIKDCYSTATVTGSKYVGGLTGLNYGNITTCYTTGAVDGDSNVGGLVGYKIGDGNIISSFWDVNTSGQTTSAGGEGKTTEEMQTLSTFTSAGWDFSYTDGDKADWFIQIDEYPILTWQISPADIYTDGKNNFRDFAIFAQYWMRKDCAIYNYYCDWADLDFNGSVDIDDLIEFMSYWLQSGIYE